MSGSATASDSSREGLNLRWRGDWGCVSKLVIRPTAPSRMGTTVYRRSTRGRKNGESTSAAQINASTLRCALIGNTRSAPTS